MPGLRRSWTLTTTAVFPLKLAHDVASVLAGHRGLSSLKLPRGLKADEAALTCQAALDAAMRAVCGSKRQQREQKEQQQ